MPEKAKDAQIWFDDDGNTVIACTALAAKYFGVTSQTLSNWVKDGCPKQSYGFFDLKAVSEYRQRVLVGTAPAPADEKDIDKMSIGQLKEYHKLRLTTEQANAAELRNRIAQGDYLERGEVVSQLKTFLSVLKRSLQSLTAVVVQQVSPYITSDDARALTGTLDETINGALEQMAVEGVYCAKDE